MRITNRTSSIIVAAALVLTLGVNSVRAGNPHAFPAYHNGNIVSLTLNTNAQSGNEEAIANKIAIPLYFVPGQDIHHVISIAPGAAGYSPFWAIYVVTVNDPSVLPLTSEADIQSAADAGAVTVSGPVGYALCPAVSR